MLLRLGTAPTRKSKAPTSDARLRMRVLLKQQRPKDAVLLRRGAIPTRKSKAPPSDTRLRQHGETLQDRILQDFLSNLEANGSCDSKGRFLSIVYKSLGK